MTEAYGSDFLPLEPRKPGLSATRRPLRVCLVVGEIPTPPQGESVRETYCRIGQALNDAGHDVTVLETDAPAPHQGLFEHGEAHDQWRGIRLVRLPASPVSVCANTSNLVIGYRAYLWLRDHDGFDFVHFPDYGGWGYYTVVAQRQGLAFRQTTTVVGVHGSSQWIRVATKRVSRDEKDLEELFVERRAAELADAVWSPTPHMVDWAREQGWDLGRSLPVRIGFDDAEESAFERDPRRDPDLMQHELEEGHNPAQSTRAGDFSMRSWVRW